MNTTTAITRRGPQPARRRDDVQGGVRHRACTTLLEGDDMLHPTIHWFRLSSRPHIVPFAAGVTPRRFSQNETGFKVVMT